MSTSALRRGGFGIPAKSKTHHDFGPFGLMFGASGDDENTA